jgi:hypothetical protein
MTPRIDKIIKKAECIKKYLESNNKESGNIDGLIKSLVSYRENAGDIPEEKLFTFSVSTNDRSDILTNSDIPIYTACDPFWKHGWEWNVPNILGIHAIEFTKYIASRIMEKTPGRHLMSLPPVYLKEHIADAVFDVQSFRVVDVLLSTELINAGFRPTTNNVTHVCDFE